MPGLTFSRLSLPMLGAAFVLFVSQTASGQGTACFNPGGPDVIVGELTGVTNYSSSGGIESFSVGTTSCNVGDTTLFWLANNNLHPVIAQNFFRLNNGRFEQLSQSWLKHGFFALQLNACGCGCISAGGSGTALGVGCSDPYSSNLNGQQSNLGPKFQVDAHTGVFAYPPANPSWSGPVARRLQIKISDIDANQQGGGKYFVEGQYVTQDDSASSHQNNNASHREVLVSGSGNSWNFSLTSSTQRERPAIRAWKDNDPTVEERNVQIPGEGLVIVGAKATDLGGGQWHYEYAVHNLNSDRSIGSFSVPCAAGITVTNIGFHDVDYHSGEPFAATDWPGAHIGNEVVWQTESFATNTNANAIRWGTLYNFRFDADVAPVFNDVSLGLFKPGGAGDPNAVNTNIITPPTFFGPQDCNANGIEDQLDILGGSSTDCNINGIPDDCDILVGGMPDCNGNGLPDFCDFASGLSTDCNGNGLPDECDIAAGTSTDFDSNGVPDECQFAPNNEICSQATFLSTGSTNFSNLNAQTDSTGEACGNFESDVWYSIIVPCTGTLTVGVCDASLDTELAVYNFACPGSPSSLLLACNDNGCGVASQVSIPVEPNFYYIRIGGKAGQQGGGTLTIDCTPGSLCTADITPPGGNGVVNIDDLVAVLNAFGPCPGCTQDITPPGGNGVVNIDDLVAVLNAFGVCP